MLRMSAKVSGATLKPSGAKRAAKRATRRILTGSSTKAAETCRKVRDSMSRLAAVRVVERAVRRLRHRVDRQIAAREIFLEGHLRTEFDAESAVARRDLALAPRERIFLLGVGVQEHREVPADLAIMKPQQLLSRAAHDHPIAFLHRQA